MTFPNEEMTERVPHPILHVVVVGFHHKKGCQVEYAYPPLIEGQPVDSHDVPQVWKNLPSLALPDGAHNCDKDTVYFHLPSQEDENTAVYGVSCYRQIDAKDVVNKSSEVTRNSIQKCVCVLSKLPLYGVIEAKLEMITYAWFSEKDFSQVSLLEETYRQLCVSCTESMLEGSQVFHGLSCRDLVMQYRHQIVTLFKLILLERKVLVYGSPVKPVCTLLLSTLSLFPDMVEFGLKEAASYSNTQQLSQTLRNVKSQSASEEDFLEIHYTNDEQQETKEGGHQICKNSSHSSKNITTSCSSGVQNNNYGKESCDTGGVNNVLGDESSSQTINGKLNKSSHTLSLNSSPEKGSNKSTSPNGGTTPCGGVREKSENETLEKDVTDEYRETYVMDSHLCQARTANCKKIDMDAIDINSVTRVEPVQSLTNVQSDEVILEQCERTNIKSDPLEFVEDVTRIEHVQQDPIDHPQQQSQSSSLLNEDLQNDLTQPNTETNSSSSVTIENRQGDTSLEQQQDVVTAQVQTDISEENLASEGTLSDFGTASNMEDLLETEEEGFDWHDDKLLLAIDSELGYPDGPEPTTADKKMERMDSTTSWASQASSVASDLGEASVKVISDIKNKLTSMWEVNPAEGGVTNELMDEADTAEVAQIHHQTHSVGPEGTPVDPSLKPTTPEKKSLTPASSPAKEKVKDNSENMCLLPVTPTTLKIDECGFPVAVFTKGVLCHPYLSLQYYDILQDVNVRGFLIGASNMLFKQKRHLLDAILAVDDAKIDIHDELLRRQLTLSTADLRFAEYLVKHVVEEKGNVFLDETEWEGGDEWLRGQFKLYLASLLITMQKGDDKLKEDFNLSFVEAYKTTNNYRVWTSTEHRGLKEAPPGHPFQGQMNMQDVKMKFAHFMQGTDKGKKIMAAAGQTGKVAVQTGKAIGGAITSAKSTVSGWFSSMKKWSSSDAPPED